MDINTARDILIGAHFDLLYAGIAGRAVTWSPEHVVQVRTAINVMTHTRFETKELAPDSAADEGKE